MGNILELGAPRLTSPCQIGGLVETYATELGFGELGKMRLAEMSSFTWPLGPQGKLCCYKGKHSYAQISLLSDLSFKETWY